MSEKDITSIVLVQMPKKLTYFVGEKAIDPAGGQICVIYADGTFNMVSMSNSDVSFSFNSDAEGPTLVTVSYNGKSLLFQAYIRFPLIRKFQIIRPPKKKEYLVGERIDLTGLELTAEYETGEKVPYKDIPVVDYITKQGDAVYPLNINGITVPIYIKVQNASIISIRMGKLPSKTEYLERKDFLDITGASIIKTYNSGVEQEVPVPYSAVRGFSNLTPGPLTLTVQVENLTTTFEVNIVEKKAVCLNIDTPPFRTSYTEGESISMEGTRVTVEYDNGESRLCEDWDYEPKIAKLNCGDIITVRAGDAVSQVAITVSPRHLMSIRVCKLPNKTQYRERRDELDIIGAELELQYDYGEPEIIPIETDMVRGFDNRMAGECQVEIQYQGLATSFSVDIIPQQLLGITITQMPEKLDYAPGENFDKTGLIVSGFYDSGMLEPLRSYSVEPDRPLIESDIAILVTSMDKTAVIPIRVAEMFRVRPEQPVEWDSDIPILDMSGGSSKPSHESKSPTPSGLPPDPNLGFVILPDPLLNRGTAASLLTDQEGAEQPKKKMSNFWGGRRLFYPSTAKLRDE